MKQGCKLTPGLMAGQDADGSGALDFDEFTALVAHMKSVHSPYPQGLTA